MNYLLKHEWLGYLVTLDNNETTFLKESAGVFSIDEIENYLESKPHAVQYYTLVSVGR